MTTRHGFSTTRIVLDQRGDGDRSEYMRRWIFSTPWFTVRLHCIKESDFGWPHNHPWNFLSLILTGGYNELLFMPYNPASPYDVVKRRPGSLRYRKRRDIHKVMLNPGTHAWTLCLTSGALKNDEGDAVWGFYTPQGRIPWQIYDPCATEEL